MAESDGVKTSATKDFFNNHGKDIVVIIFFCIGAYFTIESNTSSIEKNKQSIEELEKNKVSNATMILKEQFLGSELQRIEEEIRDLNTRLSKKIKIINDQDKKIVELEIQIAIHETRLKQGESERKGLWRFTNKFLEKLK